MNKNNLLILLFIICTLSSCQKWVDVKPATEKDRAELITTADGFKTMLYGAYIGMTEEALYGHQLTYGFVETIAYGHYYSYFQNQFISWNYLGTTARPIIDAVWSKMYFNIANVNSILKDIDNQKTLFTDQEYKVLKSEALALRAYMHFDLLRLFGPVYASQKDSIAIPYIETYERVRYPHLKASEVAGKVLADLNAAQTLVENGVDPVFTQGISNSASGKGNFLANRQYRFNYWALLAMKARLYMYVNDKENAALYANKVITEGPFQFVDPSTLLGDYADVVFMPELICALNVTKLESFYTSYFASGTYSVASGAESYANTIFDDLNDYRYLYQMTADRYGNKSVSAKYRQKTTSSSPIKKQTVPLIRLGEMYLIAAECAATNNKPKAISLLRTLRSHRGYLTQNSSISDDITDAQLSSLITKEFRKETYLEGQTFYNYKRKNQSIIPAFFSFFGDPEAGPVNFRLPIPESEKEYGIIR